MNFDSMSSYQEWAFTRLNEESKNKENLFTGLSAEVGELMSERMREIRPDRTPLGNNEIASELGDILFYVSTIAHMYDWSLDDIAEMNYIKLNSRKMKTS